MPPEGPPKEPNIDEKLLGKLIPRVRDEMLKGTSLDSAIPKIIDQISPSVAKNISHEDFSGYYNLVERALSKNAEDSFLERADDTQLLKDMKNASNERRDNLLED